MVNLRIFFWVLKSGLEFRKNLNISHLLAFRNFWTILFSQIMIINYCLFSFLNEMFYSSFALYHDFFSPPLLVCVFLVCLGFSLP